MTEATEFKSKRYGEMTQLLSCLPHEPGGLSSGSSVHVEMPDTMAQSKPSAAGEKEDPGLLASCAAWLVRSSPVPEAASKGGGRHV